MSTNAQEMNKKTNSLLQKQLEYYTNLLARHKIQLENKQPVLKSSSNALTEKLPSRFPGDVIRSSYHSNVHRPNNLNYKNCKKTVLSTDIKEKDALKKQILLTSTLQTSKNLKVLPLSNSLLKRQDKSAFSNFKVIPSKVNLNTIQQNSSQTSSKYTCKNTSEKSDSQKLMGELLAVTQQLKLKSKTLSSSDKMLSNQKSSFSFGQDKQAFQVGMLHREKVLKKSPDGNYSATQRNNTFNCSDPHKAVRASSNNTRLVFACNSKNKPTQALNKKSSKDCINSKNVKIKTARLDMLRELDTIKKVLANASEKGCKSQPTNCQDLKQLSSKTGVNSALTKVQLLNTQQNLVFPADFIKNCSMEPYLKCDINSFNDSDKIGSIKNVKSSPKLKNEYLPICDKTVTKISNLRNSKYKVVNKVQTPKKHLGESPIMKSVRKHKRSTSIKKRTISTFKLINNRRNSMHYFKSPQSSDFKNVSIHSRARLPPRQKLHKSIASNRSWQNSSSKYHLNKSSPKISGTLSKKVSNPLLPYGTDVDVDLLLELAAEKKHIKPKRVFKSKSTIINHSVQTRTAKMIKSKYFSLRRTSVWRNINAKTFKGYSRNYISKQHRGNRNGTKKFSPRRTFSNKSHCFKLHTLKKKIVNVGGEKFVIGSSGKTLKKISKQNSSFKKTERSSMYKKSSPKYSYSVKNFTPVSKRIANRALNRSINQVLSASVKKKMHKVNTYCMFYNRFGRCNKGVKCPYVHDPCKIAVCTRFLRGTCKNDKCLFSHEVNPGKMAICSFFLQGSCTKENCPYRHEKLTPDAQLCKAFVQGYCPQGKECKKAHILYCPKFIQGICDKGKNCVFPHPVVKEKKPIPKTPENIKEADDQLLETVSRYFQSSLQENVVRGLVVPKRKTLPEQPSFISLTMDDTI